MFQEAVAEDSFAAARFPSEIESPYLEVFGMRSQLLHSLIVVSPQGQPFTLFIQTSVASFMLNFSGSLSCIDV